MFLEQGYKAVSMDTIASKAGISKMTIYKYFPSKEELFLKIISMMMEKYTAIIESEMTKFSNTIDKIDYVLSFSLEASQDYSFAFYKDIMDNPYIRNRVLEEKTKYSNMFFEKIIREGIEKGEIRKCDIASMTEILSVIIEALTHNYFDKINNRDELEVKAAILYDFLKYGLFGGNEVK
ncbi:transcriptional regulator, TetR family [Alkaliphilus peptidifermentans DSM 18978]|uniref:Transcriptional regulator, TetR family n=1 Tax=Alkaliphilus peptidifermentans DSM 18978 TaxID=1120976 RepID=A0A1G5AIG7_9FIRM|nr:transcriptional regulator, TetR family [Alkaliphilus peptidifermentans DSM 18978]